MHNQDFSIHKKSSNNHNNNNQPPPRRPPHASPVTSKPEIIYNSVSWNPDAIDVTVNPNKGRKKNYHQITEKMPSKIPPSQSTYTRSTAAATVINTESNSNFESTYRSIEPGVKDAVLQSNDYLKWREMKNSFLFEPDIPSGSIRSTEPTLRDSLDLLLAGTCNV